MHAAPVDDDADQLSRAFVATIPFVERSGLQVLVAERGRAVCRLPFEGNGNHLGTVYAGALVTLAEFPGGVVTVSTFDVSRVVPLVKGIDVRFRRPARSDVTVEVRLDDDEIARLTGQVEADGKADFTLEAELVDAEGTLVATSRADYQLRMVRPPA